MLILAASTASYWPFVVLAVSVAFIIIAISKLRMHPFLALVLAGLLACLLAGKDSWDVVQQDGEMKAMSSLGGAVGRPGSPATVREREDVNIPQPFRSHCPTKSRLLYSTIHRRYTELVLPTGH